MASATILTVTALGLSGTAAAAPPTAPSYTAFHVVFDSSVETDTGSSGCDRAYDDVGDLHCVGRFTGTDTTAPFSNDGSGTVTVSRAEGSTERTLQLALPGGELAATVLDTAPNELHVTSGLASWTAGMRTPDEPGIAAGEQGGPLVLAVASTCTEPATGCTTTVELSGFVLAQPAALLLESGDEDWRPLNVYLDAEANLFFPSRGCGGYYYHGEIYEPAFRDGPWECNGELQLHRGTVPTTWPFDHGRGTAYGAGRHFASRSCCEGYLDILVPGARLSGRVEQNVVDGYARFNPHRFHIVELHVSAWAPNGGNAGNRSDIAAGEKGGPMYMEASTNWTSWDPHVRTSWTIGITGWVKVNPSSAVGSIEATTTTTSTTTSTVAPTSPPPPLALVAAPAAAVAVKPQFTG